MQHHYIDWKPAYDLGIEDIDYQHHFFLNLINRLSEEVVKSARTEYRTALIAELNAYAHFHFISEENLMMRSGYPKLEQHRQHHADLLDQLSLKENNLAMNSSEQDVRDIIDFLTNWFLKHTTHEDRLFADFLHQQEKS